MGSLSCDCRPSVMCSHPESHTPSSDCRPFSHSLHSHHSLHSLSRSSRLITLTLLRMRMRSVSLAEALYVNEGTVSPSSLHSALHSLSPSSLPSSPLCLLRVVDRVRGMSSSLTSPQLTSLSLSVTVSVACPNGSQWVLMAPQGRSRRVSAPAHSKRSLHAPQPSRRAHHHPRL